jgi:uncharacterized protein YigE (DUF2233 family)
MSRGLVIIAGDLNLDLRKDGIGNTLERNGFTISVPTAQKATTPSCGFFERGRHIDWASISGPMLAYDGQVHQSVNASDHYPISFSIRKQE